MMEQDNENKSIEFADVKTSYMQGRTATLQLDDGSLVTVTNNFIPENKEIGYVNYSISVHSPDGVTANVTAYNIALGNESGNSQLLSRSIMYSDGNGYSKEIIDPQMTEKLVSFINSIAAKDSDGVRRLDEGESEAAKMKLEVFGAIAHGLPDTTPKPPRNRGNEPV